MLFFIPVKIVFKKYSWMFCDLFRHPNDQHTPSRRINVRGIQHNFHGQTNTRRGHSFVLIEQHLNKQPAQLI